MRQSSAVRPHVQGRTMRTVREMKIQRLAIDVGGEERSYSTALFDSEWFAGSESGFDQIEGVCDDIETKPMFFLAESDDRVRVPEKVSAFVAALLEYASDHAAVMECLDSIAIEWHPADRAAGLDKPFFTMAFTACCASERHLGYRAVVGVADEGAPHARFYLNNGVTEVQLFSADLRKFALGLFDRIQRL